MYLILCICIHYRRALANTDMSAIYNVNYNLSAEERIMILSKLVFKSPRPNGCSEACAIDDGSGYPRVRVTLRGEQMHLGVPRLVYFFSIGCRPLDRGIHISHLCHNKRCISLDHLSYEPAIINYWRNYCNKVVHVCIGHGQFPYCHLPRQVKWLKVLICQLLLFLC
jgi:hypothetical protein